MPDEPRTLPALLAGLAAKIRFYTSPGVAAYTEIVRMMHDFFFAVEDIHAVGGFALALTRCGCLPIPLRTTPKLIEKRLPSLLVKDLIFLYGVGGVGKCSDASPLPVHVFVRCRLHYFRVIFHRGCKKEMIPPFLNTFLFFWWQKSTEQMCKCDKMCLPGHSCCCCAADTLNILEHSHLHKLTF